MAFPSVFSSFNRPASTDKLNAPSHSALHNSVSSALGQLEAVIGLAGASSVLGTIISDLRSPSSNGGGHIQTANTGGTGQTSFNKGDILVGQSSSVLTKLVAGLDGQILQANSSVATGLTWVNTNTNKVANSTTTVDVANTTNETSLMSVLVPASTLGLSNALRARVFIGNLDMNDTSYALKLRFNYGTTSIATMTVASIAGGGATSRGLIEMNVIANGSASSQKGVTMTDLYRSSAPYSNVTSFFGMKSYQTNTVSVDGGAQQILGITAQWNASNPSSTIDTTGYTVEKIV